MHNSNLIGLIIIKSTQIMLSQTNMNSKHNMIYVWEWVSIWVRTPTTYSSESYRMVRRVARWGRPAELVGADGGEITGLASRDCLSYPKLESRQAEVWKKQDVKQDVVTFSNYHKLDFQVNILSHKWRGEQLILLDWKHLHLVCV